MPNNNDLKRSIGLFGATGIGVGGIVGGGILALAGIAFANTGPSAFVAVLLNGLIAFITALSFAEMSSTFPESGGAYLFSKKVLSIESAFAVGWILWFATIVAAVLYALGFASFGVVVLSVIWKELIGNPPIWITSFWFINLLAILATIFYTFNLIRKSRVGGSWVNIAKLILFSILIAGGLFALTRKSPFEIKSALQPFFSNGTFGLLKAMGYTFIIMHGFDLISTVGGEIRDPEKNIPRSMMFSLGIALLIYIPLLFVISTVGVKSGESVSYIGKESLETVIAVGARNYLGVFGYWLVVAAAVLSMLSAFNANLLSASRIAFKMANDRNLPNRLGVVHKDYGTPFKAIIATAIIIMLIIIIVGNVESAGAAASLVFLITFSLAQFIAILIRKRSDVNKIPFRIPFFPLIPIIGIVCCFSLAVFQGFFVPLAGLITLIWLVFGGILFIILFGKRARVVDAGAEALDPQLVQLRGQTPLALVPISNPTNAASMVAMANALIPPKIGKVLLFTVVNKPEDGEEVQLSSQIENTQKVLKEALSASFSEGFYPEALTTVAPNVWNEIKKVSKDYNCTSLVLGLTNLSEDVAGANIEKLVNSVECDVVVLRVPRDWKFKDVKKVLVPVAGQGDHGALLARLLGTLCRIGNPEIEFLKVLPEFVSGEMKNKARDELFLFAEDQLRTQANFKVKVVCNSNTTDEIVNNAKDCDLLVLGFSKVGRYQKAFGELILDIMRNTNTPIVLISHKAN